METGGNGEALPGWPGLPFHSLYVHVPFCRHRCGYCNFAVVAGRDHLADRFVAAVLREMDDWLERNQRPVGGLKTLFLGGGTPTQLSTEQLERLVNGIASRFGVEAATEFSVECNPVDLDQQRGRELAALGVNRISLGVQSLEPGKLKLLERDHDRAIARRAVEIARSFARSVSIDLIFGTPDESMHAWRGDLAEALTWPIDHLSAYELTWEKGTPFWGRRQRGELPESGEELRVAMYEEAISQAMASGLHQYEVSSFARSVQHECRHNHVYWSGEPWLAFGPGAASFESGIRLIRHRSTTTYLQRVEAGRMEWEVDRLPVRERAAEVLCVGLRRVQGVGAVEFSATTGQDLQELAGATLEGLADAGLAELSGRSVRLTARGLKLHDGVAGRIWEGVVRR